MATQVTVKSKTTGTLTFYTSYANARSAAAAGDVIQIRADLDEQIILKDGVDIYIDPGTLVDMTDELPTVTDGENDCVCNITGGGIIKNSYTGSNKQSCVKISQSNSIVNIECFRIEGEGENSGSTEGACVDVSSAAKFRLICNRVFNKYNTAINISDCEDLFLDIVNVESGTLNNPNAGAPAMYLGAAGSIYINELKCTGYGACFQHADKVIGATINKIYTILPSGSSPSAAAPALLLDDRTGDQDLVLYFDEIKNFNTNTGDAVQITQGKASLIGRSIYSTKGKSLDLTNDIISAYIQCDEIISLTEGINIENSDEPIVIVANYIEGSDGNVGVIRSASGSNYVLRNAKIKNVSTGSNSVCIFINSGSSETDQTIEIENLILVTGNTSTGDTIRRDGNTGIVIKNLGLFVNKLINEELIILEIGVGLGNPEYNYKYIFSTDIN